MQQEGQRKGEGKGHPGNSLSPGARSLEYALDVRTAFLQSYATSTNVRYNSQIRSWAWATAFRVGRLAALSAAVLRILGDNRTASCLSAVTIDVRPPAQFKDRPCSAVVMQCPSTSPRRQVLPGHVTWVCQLLDKSALSLFKCLHRIDHRRYQRIIKSIWIWTKIAFVC